MLFRTGLIAFLATLSCFVAFGQSNATIIHGQWVQAESIGTPPSSLGLIHVRKIHIPIINAGEWVDEILVDEMGSFQWELDDLLEPTLFELSAPPWSWMVMVRPHEPSTLILSPTRSSAQSLTGTPGRSRWEGPHPSTWLDSLARAHQALSVALSEPLVLRMSGVALDGQDSLSAEWLRIQLAYEEIWSWANGQIEDQWARDLLWHDRLRWLVDSGAKQSELDSIWGQIDSGKEQRTWTSRLKSPGALNAWSLVTGRWWLSPEADGLAMNASVFMADLDSLRSAMGPRWVAKDMDEVAAAWLVKALLEPDELVKRVWETMPFSPYFRSAYNELEESRRRGRTGWKPSDVRLILPNGELENLSNQCLQPWKVLLIVKNGSSAANRERELFNQIQGNSARKDICWLVASVDSNEEAWRKSLSRRRSLEEETVWIGNNPQVFEDLGIVGVPQMVVLDPVGHLEQPYSLPSLGLDVQLHGTGKRN